MGTFVTGNSDLPAVGSVPQRTTASAATRFGATEVNELIGRIDGAHAALNDVRDHVAGWINVITYGAKGDGATDDTNAFQTALTAAWAAGGKTVLVPQGTYRIAQSLTVADKVKIVGEGTQATTLLFTYSSPPASGAAIQFTWGYNQGLSDLTVAHVTTINPEAYADNGSGIALFWPMDGGNTEHTAQDTEIRNVIIRYFTTGVRVPGESTWIRFDRVTAELGGTAFSVKDANKAAFRDCKADHNQTNWYLENTLDVLLDNCTSQTAHSTSLPSIQVKGCDGTTIRGLFTERNATDSILVTDISGTFSRRTLIDGGVLGGAGWVHASEALGRAGVALRVSNARDTVIGGGKWGGNFTADIDISATAVRTKVREPVAYDGSNNEVVSVQNASATTKFDDVSGASTVSGSLRFGAVAGPMILSGTGSPEGVYAAPVGSLFLRSDGGAGTSHYAKESGTGNTGWVAK